MTHAHRYKEVVYLILNWKLAFCIVLLLILISPSMIPPKQDTISICTWYMCKKAALVLSMDEIHASHGTGDVALSNDWGFYWLEPGGFYATHLEPLLNKYPPLKISLGWVPGGYTNTSCAWKNGSLTLVSHSWNDTIGQAWAITVLNGLYATNRFDPFVAHGYEHENYDTLPSEQVEAKLTQIQQAFFNVTGHPATGFNTFPFFKERLDITPLFVNNGFYHLGVRGDGFGTANSVRYYYQNGTRIILLPYTLSISNNTSVDSLEQLVEGGINTNSSFAMVRIFIHARSKFSCESGKTLSDSLEGNHAVVENLFFHLFNKYGNALWFTTDHEAAHYFDIVNNVRTYGLQRRDGAIFFEIDAHGTLFNWTDFAPITLLIDVKKERIDSLSCSSTDRSYSFTTSNFTTYNDQLMVDVPFPNKNITCKTLLSS